MTDNADPYRRVAAYYNNEYYGESGHHAGGSHHFRELLIKIRPHRHDYVLDIACGTGDWLAVAGRYSDHTFGTDISETALRTCRTRLPAAGLCLGLGESLPFADQSFDLVTCLGSLEHFLDQPKALQQIRRVARDGAAIVILVPNAGFLTHRLGLYRGTDQTRIRETLRSIEEWCALFSEAGLQVTDMWADRHVQSRHWIFRGAWYRIPLRALQALMLLIWPLRWQYQVYFLCRLRR